MRKSKSYRELRGGATQSKLRFESRLGAEQWKQVVLLQPAPTLLRPAAVIGHLSGLGSPQQAARLPFWRRLRQASAARTGQLEWYHGSVKLVVSYKEMTSFFCTNLRAYKFNPFMITNQPLGGYIHDKRIEKNPNFRYDAA
ncbi:hypothetical protein [Paenibacillus sp. Soil522]|uniref:hypothetical protein n=1 Tax=Paenibacillus sp. Soil522 TaxID=1736388 RepID=UPI0006FACCD2|nr:hypothetical protein [Paenibacillus sp. Soil522]KRE32599.1 hypothetical protein ASG81_24010 [Paenibacillus sp. Soil522]